MSAPLTPSDTITLLESIGQRPRKRLGQNFLIEGNIVRKSIEWATLSDSDVAIEIGPGLGTLTQALIQSPAKVYAVELDIKLFTYIESQYASKGLNIIHGDALDFPLASFDPHTQSENYKIIANLPYAISTPWLDKVLEMPKLPSDFVLMLQKEAADRYMASAGSKNFGAISIFLNASYELKHEHQVSRTCFYPTPEIDSILVHWQLKPNPVRFNNETKKKIRYIFTQRRKQIKSLCKKDEILSTWLEHLTKEGILPHIRPEAIPQKTWEILGEKTPS